MQHAGRIPNTVKRDVSIRANIERLRQQLQRAIAQEEYEKAATLRDTIRSLQSQLSEASRGDIHVKPQDQLKAEAEKGDDSDA